MVDFRHPRGSVPSCDMANEFLDVIRQKLIDKAEIGILMSNLPDMIMLVE